MALLPRFDLENKMAKIAYFVDVSQGDYQDFLSSQIYWHRLVVSMSRGASPGTARYLETMKIAAQDFWEARAQGVFELPGDQRYFLSDMVASLPGGGLLEVLYPQDMRKNRYVGDLVLWRPVTREEGDELSAAFTVADLQSHGFEVFDGGWHNKITHSSIAPYEDIEIAGPGQVIYHGKNEALIAKHSSEWMNRMDGQMRAAQRDHDQVYIDIARRRWNVDENVRTAALRSRGWLATKRRCPY